MANNGLGMSFPPMSDGAGKPKRSPKKNPKFGDDTWQTYGTRNSTRRNLKQLNEGQSFYNNNRKKPTAVRNEVKEKVLPPSQPLIMEATSLPSHQNPIEASVNTSAGVEINSEKVLPVSCPICKEDVKDGEDGISCDMCVSWLHKNCLHMTDEEFTELRGSETPWFCARCRLIRANKIKWGDYEGEESINEVIKSTYNKIIGWKNNIFMLPRGKVGVDCIKELTRLINLLVHKTKWERLSLALVHIFLPIMLQKPSAKSKPRDHAKYLKSRLEHWSLGNIKQLMDETTEIQKRMMKSLLKKEFVKEKAFIRQMMLGKVGQETKHINNDDSIKGVHQLNDQIKNILLDKHPKRREADVEILIPNTVPPPQAVIFEEIDAERVQKIAKRMKGSGGPSLIDSETWRHLLCSKVFDNASAQLSQATTTQQSDTSEEGRKQVEPGVRPIGLVILKFRLSEHPAPGCFVMEIVNFCAV